MKHIPKLKTDAAAEAFLEKDLSGQDFSQFKPARFEFQNSFRNHNLGDGRTQ